MTVIPYINCLTCQIWVNFAPFQIFFEWVYDKTLAFENALVYFLAFLLTILALYGWENNFFKKRWAHLRVILKLNPYINCLTCQIWANFAPFQIFFEGVYDKTLTFGNALVNFLAFVLTISSLSGREKFFSKKVEPMLRVIFKPNIWLVQHI